MRAVATLTIGLLAAIAVVACGGGGDSEFEKALEELRASDLSVLVLPPEQMGEIAAGFVIDDDSGPETAADSAEGTLDPDDTEADVQARGFVAGYGLTTQAEALPEEGVFEVESSVVFYDDADGVDAALDKLVADLERFEGETTDGVELVSIGSFDPGSRGDRAVGRTAELAVPDSDVRVYGVVVAFRIGRLGASVSIASIDDADRTDDVKVLAERLETHIRAVLLGETAATVVPIPGQDADADPPDDDGDGDPVVANLEQAFVDLPLEMQDGRKLGSDDAPVKMVQYEDLQCPFCLRYAADQEPFLIEEYVKAGLLQIEFKHLPILGTESVAAAIGATCAAEQNRMWEYANRLFTLQARAGQHLGERLNIGRFDESALVDVAVDLGLDEAAFATCQASASALDRVAQDRAEARSIGLGGTPSFVINGAPLQAGNPGSDEGWRTVIESFLAVPPPGTPDLSLLVLAADDLPDGFVLDEEGYDPAPAGEAEYSRDFDSRGRSTEVGTTQIGTVQSGAILFESDTEALIFLTTIDALFASEDAVDIVFGAALAEEGLGDVQLESERVELDVGDGGVALVARGDTNVGGVAFAFLVFRDGPYVGNVIVVGLDDGFQLGDIGRLAQPMVERIAAAPR